MYVDILVDFEERLGDWEILGDCDVLKRYWEAGVYFSGLVSTRLANARIVSTELVSLLWVEFGVCDR